MNKTELDNLFLSFKGAELTYPFGEEAKVFKVYNKMFGLVTETEGVLRVNLKGDPDDNIALRNMFDSIKPGYHMNKTHWNSLYLDESLNDDLIARLVAESYEIVVSKLPKKDREALGKRI